MTESPPWPRIGGRDRWTHLTVNLERDAPGPAAPVVTFEIWSRYPAAVVREWVDGKIVREVRANTGKAASLDVERRLCLAETGQDGEAYEAAVAIAAGPVAELYGAANLDGWRRRKTARKTVTYYNDRDGQLRQATIDARTGLPLEADSVDGRWRWVIVDAVKNHPPLMAPDVTDWPKESHERTELPIDDRPVEDIRYRSSALGTPLEFIAFGEEEGSARAVIAPDARYKGDQLKLPDGRTATVIAGGPLISQRLIEQVTRGRGVDPAAPYVAEEADHWNERINELVSNIVPGYGPYPGPKPRSKPRWRPSAPLLAAIAVIGALGIAAVAVSLGIWPPAPAPSPVPVLGAALGFRTLDVQPSGDWTGTVTVTPTGGIAPYAIQSNGDVRQNTPRSEQFPIGNSGCALADVLATVRSQDGQSQDVSGSYRPDRCADFAVPPTPGLGDPPDGWELRSNCTSKALPLRGFAAGDLRRLIARETPPGSTWTFEVESRTDADWTPMRSVSGNSEPVFQTDFPCATVYRWRLATVSPDGWQSEFSPWSMFAIRPTAIPVLDPPRDTSCHPPPWKLTWTADPTDGIGSYVVEVVDLQGKPVRVNVDGATAYVDGACGTEYQWHVASVDAQGNQGQFSDWTPFTIPAPAIIF